MVREVGPKMVRSWSEHGQKLVRIWSEDGQDLVRMATLLALVPELWVGTIILSLFVGDHLHSTTMV